MPAMRSVDRSVPGGAAPVDPQEKVEAKMTRSQIIKCRISERQKKALQIAAKRAGLTLSDMLRSGAIIVSGGRTTDGVMRREMAHVRQAANAFLAITDGRPLDPTSIEETRKVASNLHALASRHLGPRP